MSGEEPFVKRWSRLKRERREEAKAAPDAKPEPKPEAAPTPPAAAAAPNAGAEKGDPKAAAELPPIESLGKDSDYSAFMREGVPTALRLAALRKLWASDPALAVMDPLDLHNIDYTHLAAPGQVVTSSYQVGRGFAAKVEESIERVEAGRGKEENDKSESAPAATKAASVQAKNPKALEDKAGGATQPAEAEAGDAASRSPAASKREG